MKKKDFFIEKSVVVGENVKIGRGVEVLGVSVLEDGVTLKGATVLEDAIIGAGTVIESSKVTKSKIGKNCRIGPFSHIRENCMIADGVKIGSFVELKNAKIGEGTKIPHLSYVGDAEIGKNVNIGCGVVFANYNGKTKQTSKVGDRVFVGCNVNIVAPVNIAEDTYICAGTTVTNDTQKGDFVIGRVRQENKKR